VSAALRLSLLLILLAACEPAEPWPSADGVPHEDLQSAAVGDTFRLYTNLPAGYEAEPDRQWPLFVYLDGDWAAGTVRDLHLPVVAVGVGYPGETQRDRDYLFPAGFEVAAAGGAERFHEFLTQELVPWAESRYRIDPSLGRTLGGHSRGGYFVMFAFLRQREQTGAGFDRFVAGSPPQFYAEGYLFGLEERLAEGGPELPASLFMAVGGLESVPMNATFDEMVERLRGRDYEGLRLHAVRYDDLGHDTLRETYRDGVPFALGGP
jgi:uncharacterized protein